MKTAHCIKYDENTNEIVKCDYLDCCVQQVIINTDGNGKTNSEWNRLYYPNEFVCDNDPLGECLVACIEYPDVYPPIIAGTNISSYSNDSRLSVKPVPNPASEQTKILVEKNETGFESGHLLIISSGGLLEFESDIRLKFDNVINTTNLASGSYICIINYSEYHYFFNLIVNK